MSTGFAISLKFVLYAKPEDVFKTLTDSGVISKWSNSQGELQTKEGGKFSWFDDWVNGKVLEVNKNQMICFTWKPKDWSKKTKESIVTILLNKHAAGTEISLSQVDLPSSKELKNHKNGWIDYVFEPLNDYFSLELKTS